MSKERISFTFTFPSSLLPKFDKFKETLSSYLLKRNCIENKVLTIGPSKYGTRCDITIIYIPIDNRYTDIFLKEWRKETIDFIDGWRKQGGEYIKDPVILSYGPLVTEELTLSTRTKTSSHF